ncbi:MAG: ABC transporter substrate-binding protein [Anaerolineae bacterium]
MFRIHQRIALAVALTIFVLLLAGCAGQTAAPAAAGETAPLTPITLYMGFRPDVQFAPFYVGIEKGFFAEQGIALTTQHASESDMVRLVGTGEILFAIVSGEQVLLARAQGVPIVYVYEWYEDYPVAIAAKAGMGINTPADLAGRSVGVPMQEGASYIGLEALLASAGLTDADINLQVTGFTQVETLATDRVEAVVIYASNEPVQLEAQGIEAVVIRVADYSDLVSNGMITSEEVIREQPELVRAMAAALTQALEYTAANPDEAFAIAQQYVEGLDDPALAEVQKAVLERSIALWGSGRYGETDLAAWQAMQDLLLRMGLLDTPQDLEAAFTNEFLP